MEWVESSAVADSHIKVLRTDNEVHNAVFVF